MAKKKRRTTRATHAGRRAPARTAPRRADYGKPIDGFFAKRPPEQRAILDALRKIVEKEVPDATAALKWGQPVYSLGTKMMIVLSAHKAHVNLVLVGPAKSFADPDGLLEGSSTGGRHIKLRSIDDLPPAATLRGWVRQAATNARRF